MSAEGPTTYRSEIEHTGPRKLLGEAELVAPPGCAMSLCNSPSETGAAAVASTLIEATAAGHCRGSAAVSWLAS